MSNVLFCYNDPVRAVPRINTLLEGHMAEDQPSYDYLKMTDEGMTAFGFEAGTALFCSLKEAGLLNNNSLFMRAGVMTESDERFVEFGTQVIGDGMEYAVNTDPDTGKIATVIEFQQDSIAAFSDYGERVGDGPRQWTGGVFYVARVKLASGRWLYRVFVGAASGVQGHFDQVVMYAVLTTMGAAWAQRELAREAAGLSPSEAATA